MRSVKMAVLFAVVGCFTASSALAAEDPVVTPTSSQVCKDLRTQMGSSLFKATYGTNKNKANALGKCISARANALAGQAKKAKSDCKAEQAADAAAFKAKYGTNKNKNNAYGKCVSGKATAAADAQTKALVNAAKQCKTERAADAAAFKAKYGTNKNKANAFGKCVSKIASAKS